MYSINDLNAMSESDLKSLAKSMGIKKVESIDKEDLVYHVLDQQAVIDSAKTPDKPQRKRTKTQKDSTAKKASKKSDNETVEEPVEEKKAEPTEQNPAEESKAAPQKRGRKPKKQEAPKETETKEDIKTPEDAPETAPDVPVQDAEKAVENQPKGTAPESPRRGKRNRINKLNNEAPTLDFAVQPEADIYRYRNP